MASKQADTTAEAEHTKYSRLCRMVVELCRDMLWKLLESKIPIHELPEKVRQNLLKLEQFLDKDQLECLGIGKGKDLPSETDVDISILYVLLRSICKIKAPKTGWFNKRRGIAPDTKDLKVGADIERIHLKRNILYGHAKKASLDEKSYKREVDDLRAIASRMDSRLNTQKKFTKFLKKLEKCCMDPEMEKEYIEQLLKQKEREEVMEERIEKVEERIEKVEAATINITQQHIGSTSTSEVKVQSNISSLCERDILQDAVVMYAETDSAMDMAKEFKRAVTELTSPLATIHLKDELGHAGLTESHSWERCINEYRYIFILMTDDMDNMTKFAADAVLFRLIGENQYRVVPIWLSSVKTGHSMFLSALKGLKYYKMSSSEPREKEIFISGFKDLICNGR